MHKPTDTENVQIKMKDAKKYRAIYLHDLPDWLQEFRENVVDESGFCRVHGENPSQLEHRDTSSSFSLIAIGVASKSGTGLGTVSTLTSRKTKNCDICLGFLQKTCWYRCAHVFPKDRNCDICLRTKITRAPCRKRTGTVVRAENFGDLVTADCKVLSEGCESRHTRRYAVVVQDSATQWLQSYPCKTKTP